MSPPTARAHGLVNDSDIAEQADVFSDGGLGVSLPGTSRRKFLKHTNEQSIPDKKGEQREMGLRTHRKMQRPTKPSPKKHKPDLNMRNILQQFNENFELIASPIWSPTRGERKGSRTALEEYKFGNEQRKMRERQKQLSKATSSLQVGRNDVNQLPMAESADRGWHAASTTNLKIAATNRTLKAVPSVSLRLEVAGRGRKDTNYNSNRNPDGLQNADASVLSVED